MFVTRKEELDIKEIKEYIKKHSESKEKALNLQDYYEGKKTDSPYPKYISDTHTGYFLGTPITYKCEDTEYLDKILAVFRENNESKHNKKLGKLASVQGKAYELLYADEDSQVKFAAFSRGELFLIKSASLDSKILYAVRYFSVDGVAIINVIDSEKTSVYEGKNIDKAEWVEDIPHYFEEVPVVEYKNNEECQGDFEQVLFNIDAYDTAQKNTLQDLNDFTDAYLALENMLGTEDDDVTKFKKDKILLLPDGSKAYWLIKNVNDAWIENYKNRIKRDIHKFSSTPDLTDEQFGSNLSGISLQYKMLGTEQVRGIKESEFRESINRRIKLICKILKLKQDVDETKTIEMQFNKTLPKNVFELSQIITNLAPYLSQETLLSRLPFIEDVNAEIEAKKKETTSVKDNYEG